MKRDLSTRPQTSTTKRSRRAVHLDRVDSRQRLEPTRDPYWQRLSAGRHIGFRRMTAGSLGTWLARFYDGKRYHYHPLGDFALIAEKKRYDEAKKAAEAWFGHLDVGGAVDPGTVAAACEAYVQHLRQTKSEAAATDADGRFKRLVYGDPKRSAHAIARVLLSRLTKADVSTWRDDLLKNGGSKGAFNRNATALRAALNLAKAKGKIATDQAWAQQLTPIKGADGRRELYLDAAERASLVEHASNEAKPFLDVLRLLPLRPGDVAKLQVRHLDKRNAMLKIPVGKTDSRDVPLSASAAALLRELARDKLPTASLVARAEGSQWKKEAWRDEVKAAATAAKLPAATVAYTLRHSVITDLVVGGLDLFTVAQISGTSVEMIERHYGKLRQARAREALDALAQM